MLSNSGSDPLGTSGNFSSSRAFSACLVFRCSALSSASLATFSSLLFDLGLAVVCLYYSSQQMVLVY
jgi:hypothetical protein